MSVINTNITSMIGQQNLNESKNALTTSMERLSSGLRINSAKDDAAGQAIANRMSSQITGLAQSQRNANDGISVSQTAEGALNQVNDNLQRVRELSVQAQNGTNSADDLQSIQDEIGQRLDEIDRISKETEFNGVKVLSEDQGIKIQVGANDGQQISVNLQEINSTTLGLDGFSVAGADIDSDKVAAAAPSATVGTDPDVEVERETDLTEAKIQVAAGTADSAPDNGDFGKFYKDSSGNYFVEVTGADTDTNNGYYSVTVRDNNTGDAAGEGTLSLGAKTTDTDTIIELSDAESVDTAEYTATLESSGTAKDIAGLRQYDGAQGTDGAPKYVIEDTNADGDTVYFEAEVDNAGNVNRGDQLTTGSDLNTKDPLQTLDDALKQVDSFRSELGAVQNRFESAITNLSTNETNLSSARSRIEDADYATEVANMTKNQILQQAGTSVLAQANQLPQSVLSLLG